MPSPMRKQRPRGSITREAVVNAALSVTDSAGVKRLTIRAVADLLRAPPMSLYSHFANKNQLLDLMYAEIARRVYLYEAHPSWQDELLALARRIRGLLSAHPNWTTLLSRPVPPLEVTLREQVLRLMVADGLTPTDALMGLSGVALTSIGLMLIESTMNGPAKQSALVTRFARLKEWVETAAADEHRETRAALATVARFDFDYLFQFAIQSLITGLEAKRSQA